MFQVFPWEKKMTLIILMLMWRKAICPSQALNIHELSSGMCQMARVTIPRHQAVLRPSQANNYLGQSDQSKPAVQTLGPQERKTGQWLLPTLADYRH